MIFVLFALSLGGKVIAVDYIGDVGVNVLIVRLNCKQIDNARSERADVTLCELLCCVLYHSPASGRDG